MTSDSGSRRRGRRSDPTTPAPASEPPGGCWGPHLDALVVGEGTAVLSSLLNRHPELLSEAEAIARVLLSQVTFQQVAEHVAEDVQGIGIDEIRGRAGRHEDGYVEPEEAAGELLEEALAPFHADLHRFLDAGLRDLARQVCMGIVLGLYRTSREGKAPLLDMAPDFPAEAAGWVVEEWCLLLGPKGRKQVARGGGADDSPLPEGFVETWVPEWRTFLSSRGTKAGRYGSSSRPA